MTERWSGTPSPSRRPGLGTPDSPDPGRPSPWTRDLVDALVAGLLLAAALLAWLW